MGLIASSLVVYSRNIIYLAPSTVIITYKILKGSGDPEHALFGQTDA